jgi:hypothetical protein
VLVRPARPSDAEPLVPVFEDWSHALPAHAIAERLAAWADEPRAVVLVAEHDGTVVGVAAVSAGLHVARPAEELARGWGCDRLFVCDDLTSLFDAKSSRADL